MSKPAVLTDRNALGMHRRRALSAPAFFLLEDTADEIHERLNEVNRTFRTQAVVAPFSDFWVKHFPGAKLVLDDNLLDIESEAHDLIIDGLSLHWANDPVGQLIQIRRALRPDGLFLGAMFGGQTLHELRSCLAEAEARLTGGLSPRVAPMGEIRDLGALLQRAGFALPVADTAVKTVSYLSVFHLMKDLRAMGETNALALRHKTIPPKALFAETANIYSQKYGTANGRIPATFEIVYLTGWAPDESQQKPLRPGSAKTRLADALGTTETPISD